MSPADNQCFTALAVLAPAGKLIAQGRHRLELRSWQPPSLPLRNLLIVESARQVNAEGQWDPEACGVALVDVVAVQPWKGLPGMYAWQLDNIRPILPRLHPLPAKAGLYQVSPCGSPEALET